MFSALIGYIWYEAPEEEKNFSTLLDFVNASEVREDDDSFQNGVDLLFLDLEKEEPDYFAVRQYKRFKLAAGKTATIEGNCDSLLFLGGKEESTLKEMSEILGKETIDYYNQSDTRGRDRSFGVSYQKTGKELMSKDELAVMDGGKCILQLRGVRPFLSDKYDITKHPNYMKLADYDKRNTFDVEAYVRRRCRLKKTDVVRVYEC